MEGDSAGGHIALWVGIVARSQVACVVNEFGLTNLLSEPFGSQQIARAWQVQMQMPAPAPAACTDMTNPYCAASPLYSAAGLPPLMVVYGTNDVVSIPRQSIDLIAAAQAAQIPVTSLPYVGGHEMLGLTADEKRVLWTAELNYVVQVLQPAASRPQRLHAQAR